MPNLLIFQSVRRHYPCAKGTQQVGWDLSCCLRAPPGGAEVEPISVHSLAATARTDKLVLLVLGGSQGLEERRLQAWQKNSEWRMHPVLPHHKTILDPA